MAVITFKTRTNEAHVRRAERAFLDHLVNGIFYGILEDEPDCLREIIVCESIDQKIQEWQDEIDCGQYRSAARIKLEIRELTRLQLSAGWHLGFSAPSYTQETMDPWPYALNTALSMASDPLKLLIFIHAQCEMHLWVGGKNRKWMADLIEKGLKGGIYRQKMGWESVIELLRASVRGPLVTEFSGSDSFDWKDGPPSNMELTPERLQNDTFVHDYTVFDLNRWAQERAASKKQQKEMLNAKQV